jgi:hypothetical protein
MCPGGYFWKLYALPVGTVLFQQYCFCTLPQGTRNAVGVGCRLCGFVRIVIPYHITIITLRLLNFGSPSLPARTIRVPLFARLLPFSSCGTICWHSESGADEVLVVRAFRNLGRVIMCGCLIMSQQKQISIQRQLRNQ